MFHPSPRMHYYCYYPYRPYPRPLADKDVNCCYRRQLDPSTPRHHHPYPSTTAAATAVTLHYYHHRHPSLHHPAPASLHSGSSKMDQMVHPQGHLDDDEKEDVMHAVNDNNNNNEDILNPHENDVLMGRGGKNNKHLGNEKLRQIAKVYCARYYESSRKEKSRISNHLVQHVRQLDPPGRFLKRDLLTGKWSDVGDKIAREKTSQVLRDAVALTLETSRSSPSPSTMTSYSTASATAAAAAPHPVQSGSQHYHSDTTPVPESVTSSSVSYKYNPTSPTRVTQSRPTHFNKRSRRSSYSESGSSYSGQAYFYPNESDYQHHHPQHPYDLSSPASSPLRRKSETDLQHPVQQQQQVHHHYNTRRRDPDTPNTPQLQTQCDSSPSNASSLSFVMPPPTHVSSSSSSVLSPHLHPISRLSLHKRSSSATDISSNLRAGGEHGMYNEFDLFNGKLLESGGSGSGSDHSSSEDRAGG